MKKFLALILALAMLFAFTSCGEKQNAETKPDYSKIHIYMNNGSLTLASENFEDLVENLNTAFHFMVGNTITVQLEYIPSEFDDIDYTNCGNMIMSFDMQDFTIEEMAREIEKISAVSRVASITTEALVNIGEIDYSKIIVPLGQKGDKIPVNREDLIELLNSHIAIESPDDIRMYIPGHIEEERFLDMLNYSFYKHIEQGTFTHFVIYTEDLDVERFADALEQLTRYSDISRIVLRQYPIPSSY